MQMLDIFSTLFDFFPQYNWKNIAEYIDTWIKTWIKKWDIFYFLCK